MGVVRRSLCTISIVMWNLSYQVNIAAMVVKTTALPTPRSVTVVTAIAGPRGAQCPPHIRVVPIVLGLVAPYCNYHATS